MLQSPKFIVLTDFRDAFPTAAARCPTRTTRIPSCLPPTRIHQHHPHRILAPSEFLQTPPFTRLRVATELIHRWQHSPFDANFWSVFQCHHTGRGLQPVGHFLRSLIFHFLMLSLKLFLKCLHRAAFCLFVFNCCWHAPLREGQVYSRSDICVPTMHSPPVSRRQRHCAELVRLVL